MESLPLVVYAQLRWSATQKQLLSRIADTRHVIYFEETLPARPGVPDSIELSFPQSNVIVARPILQGAAGAFDAERIGAVARRLLEWQSAERHVAWVCTPLAFGLARALSPERLIYDGIEELASLGASPRALDRSLERLDLAGTPAVS